jgi:hypothetical protein
MLEVGTLVFAQWQDGLWYPGSVAAWMNGGYRVQFEDGSAAWAATDQVATLKGLRVLAPWSDGQLYPGEVKDVLVEGECVIEFDDGETGRADYRSLKHKRS